MLHVFAVENVGREVFLIRDNKVVGEGYSQTSAHGMISIEMRDDRAKAIVEDSSQVKAFGEAFPEKKYKWSFFRFYKFDGSYADNADDGDRYFPGLTDIRVVDKLYLGYGMVPDTFTDVEGYRASIT
jgi:hypothetical protein